METFKLADRGLLLDASKNDRFHRLFVRKIEDGETLTRRQSAQF